MNSILFIINFCFSPLNRAFSVDLFFENNIKNGKNFKNNDDDEIASQTFKTAKYKNNGKFIFYRKMLKLLLE